MSIRDTIRKLTPSFLLRAFRKAKKKKVNRQLNQMKYSGEVITLESLCNDFRTAGILEGDTVLVHSSMSKLGYLESGADTFIDAILKVIGPKGNLLMPSSPNPTLQLDFIQSNKIIDLRTEPSALGKITEEFRKREGVLRSSHPTEPVCAYGPNAEYLTSGHLGEITPYTSNSPFSRLYELGGKILYVGVTLNNAGTNLHTMEDAVDFPYPVYYPETFYVTLIDLNGVQHKVQTKVHNPEWSAKRKCDELIPRFMESGVCTSVKIGRARTLVFDGKKMFEVMVSGFESEGITMYHPSGRN